MVPPNKIVGKLSFRVNSYLALGMGILIIGFSAIFIRQANAPGTITVFYRMAIGSLVMTLPFVLHLRTQKRRLPLQGVLIAIFGGACLAVDLALWSTGIVMSGAASPTLMANTAPLWVGLGALLLFREHQSIQFWIGLSVTLVGVIVVMGKDLLHSINFGVGSSLGLLAAIFYGAYLLVCQHGRNNLSTLTYFWLTTFSAAITLLILNIILQRPFTGYSMSTYLNFLLQGAVVQVFGWISINYAQGHLPASIVAPTLLAQPILTALFAWLLLGEQFTMWHVVGGAVVISGIYTVHRSRHIVPSFLFDSQIVLDRTEFTDQSDQRF
ncbi:MAG: DMT family transporter [SAR324 cluster bacterium]|nr:DMT family transporter [SAR324 cluster bacterium]